MKNRWSRSARKIRKRFRRELQKWNVRRQRNVKLTGRGSERGPAVLRKQGLKLLGRENIPVHSVKHHHVIPAFYIS